ncbi:MAG: lipoate--protein ligase [Bacteroidales bacterium]|nr:lipoate--protein ligase [Bacteroidales bacterium]MBN2818160.1 lipoate--protein ligase [Bacteroidales bacterium]
MLYILSDSFDPYFNLATEEYLLKNKTEDIFFLWRSPPAVVVGKHQNALAEINYKYVRENNILVARRLSGGGTVVHDLQNLNFSFISKGEEGKLIDFKKYISPVIDYLATIGLQATIGEKNDIRINDLKISGNAEHVFRKRVLHHGTLLFNSDLEQLRKAIQVTQGLYFDKAVQSNRSGVTNITNHLSTKLKIEEFVEGLSTHIMQQAAKSYKLSTEETELINNLKTEKYKTTEWIFGYSPRYNFKNSFIFNNQIWDIELHIEKGKIVNSKIIIEGSQNKLLEEKLLHSWHLYDPVLKLLKTTSLSTYEKDISRMCNYFFSV